MKTIAVFALLFALAIPVVSQDVVSEAKTSLATKKHKSMVEKAERLLEQKKDLEKQLADVDAKLSKLANGEDVKVTDDITTVQWGGSGSISTCGCLSNGLCCMTGTGR